MSRKQKYIGDSDQEIVLLDNTTTNPIAIVSIGMAMFQEMEDNIINMTRTIHEYEEHIKELKDKQANIQNHERNQS